jgi:hypothetical protein
MRLCTKNQPLDRCASHAALVRLLGLQKTYHPFLQKGETYAISAPANTASCGTDHHHASAPADHWRISFWLYTPHHFLLRMPAFIFA